MTIRRFSLHDQKETRALILEGLGEHFGFIDETANPDLEDIQEYYVNTGCVFLIAERAQEIIGTGCLVRTGPETGKLVRMSTAKSCRREGVGTALLNALLNEAREMQITEITVATEPDWTDAVSFYRSHGFVAFGKDEIDIFLRLNIHRNSSRRT